MMQEEKFENYIRDHKADFDDKTPPASAWDKIEAQLGSTASPGYIRYWQAAAVLFFAISIGLLVTNYRTSQDNEIAVSESAEEFRTTEEYYFDVIESQQGLLTTYLKQYPELAKDFKKDLAELSQNYNKLKKDFEATGEMEVLNALINNLRLQQELLSNQLEIIQQIEEENENVSI